MDQLIHALCTHTRNACRPWDGRLELFRRPLHLAEACAWLRLLRSLLCVVRLVPLVRTSTTLELDPRRKVLDLAPNENWIQNESIASFANVRGFLW
jgi:hypothetical protein